MDPVNRLVSGYGGIFHVTQRCHNREFLLNFALDRDGYRAKLRDHLREFEVARQISGLMRTLAGEFARACNRRKARMKVFGR